jgi:hypothetical protein
LAGISQAFQVCVGREALLQLGKVLGRLCTILAGDLTRRVLLCVWLPLIAFFYFGILAIAARFSAHTYDWRRVAISKLLYPGYDPRFHAVASLGVALAGLLMFPLAGYIRRRLSGTSAVVAAVGALALGLGSIGLVLAGLIVSHPAQGTPFFPRLHEMLARTAACALGAGMIVFWACAAKGYAAKGHAASPTESNLSRWLLISWSALTVPALLIAILRAAAGADLHWSNPIYQTLQSRAFWRLGFWEWLGSAAVYLFLLSGVLFLPETD